MMFDKNNLPLHNGDGGDCIHNVGRIAILKWLKDYSAHNWEYPYDEIKKEYIDRIFFLIDEKGFLRRHNTQWNDPKDMSRDGTEPVILANMIFFPDLNKQIWRNVTKKFPWSYQNGDIFAPHHLAIWGRVFNGSVISRFLGDFFLFVFVCFRVCVGVHLKDRGKPSVGNDINLILMVRLFQKIQPTRLMKLANWIYKRKYRFCIANYFQGSPLADYMKDLYFNELRICKGCNNMMSGKEFFEEGLCYNCHQFGW